MLLTSDEEIGSPSSRGLVENTARGARAALVLEPSVDGAVKTARKGVGHVPPRCHRSRGRMPVLNRGTVRTRCSPWQGIVRDTSVLGDLSVGTTVTPTTASAGTTRNVVPDTATCEIDVRGETAAELQRVDAAIRALVPDIADTSIEDRRRSEPPADGRGFLSGASSCGPNASSGELGIGELRGRAVGGGSDGNFTAGIGVPTLDGLGAVGDGAHARHEHVVVDEMPKRAALLAALIRELCA